MERVSPAIDIAAASKGLQGERRQLRDDVASYLRQLIISGNVRPTELLRLNPLAEELGVSITPVREALLLLSQDGWVIQEPNRGFRIAPIKRQDLGDAYLVNAFAASTLAGRAASLADRGPTVGRLRELDTQIAALTDAGRLDELSALNARVHRTIYEAADSPRLLSFAVAASRFVPRRFWNRVPGWVELNRAGHDPIIGAIEAGDHDAAATEMHDHISAAGEILIEYLDSIKLFDFSDAAV